VVIPVIDEAEALGALIADLHAQRGVRLQIVVADGGSIDTSRERASAAGATVIESPAGRGVQMNAGAAVATSDWLCFLHADSRLTRTDQLAGAIRQLTAAGAADSAGHFRLRFSGRGDRRGFFYRYLEAKTASGRRHTINGDQGLLLHRDLFAAIGGFDTGMAFLEDQRMAAAIEGRGRWLLLEHELVTSARRFRREGEYSRYLLMALIMAMHLARVPAFFEQAPAVYSRQRDTRRLALTPYFRLLRELMRRCGARASIRVCWRMASIALAESWQPFLAFDVALAPVLGARRRVFLGLHDRWLRPLIVHVPGQALLMLILAMLIFGPLQLGCWLRERVRPFE